jgi:hypothetical protein
MSNPIHSKLYRAFKEILYACYNSTELRQLVGKKQTLHLPTSFLIRGRTICAQSLLKKLIREKTATQMIMYLVRSKFGG